MKKLKFRVWDKGHNKMSYKVNLYSMNHRGEMDKAQIGDQQFMKGIGFACEVMQYIGINDKKNKEIFTSDILKWEYYHPTLGKQTHYGQVVYDAGKACFGVEYMDGELHYFGSEVFQQSCEVIGNIYENPEFEYR